MATEIGALSHLVEAASALEKLDCRSAEQLKHSTSVLIPDVQGATKEPLNNSVDAKVPPNNNVDANSRGKRDIFPQRLLAVLNNESLSDVISWLPHGKSFVIIRPDVFTEKVMPTYFPPVDARGSTKYPSFTRKLNRWGFRQATRGPDTGAFHHPLFCRDRPELCADMVCQRSRGSLTAGSKYLLQDQIEPRNEELLESSMKIAPLTKESIETILPTPCTVLAQTVATVSIDETRSVTSNTSSSSQSSPFSDSLPNITKSGITTDKDFVDSTIRHRDEIERMRIAQALLYKAFTSALQERSSS